MNSYLDKQHNTGTNKTEGSAELDNFTDLHIDDNDDNQLLSNTDYKWAVQLWHYINYMLLINQKNIKIKKCMLHKKCLSY